MSSPEVHPSPECVTSFLAEASDPKAMVASEFAKLKARAVAAHDGSVRYADALLESELARLAKGYVLQAGVFRDVSGKHCPSGLHVHFANGETITLGDAELAEQGLVWER